MKKIFENAVWWSGVVMVGLILGISLQFVRAWTEPTEAPPGGNVGAPINTGNNLQQKSGSLALLGQLITSFINVPGDVPAPGDVLTAQNAAGQVAWAAGGGGTCFTYYCNTSPSGGDGGIECVDEGGLQKHCPLGSSEKFDLGRWGACIATWGGMGYASFSPPGGGCFVSSGWGYNPMGKAFVCCQ